MTSPADSHGAFPPGRHSRAARSRLETDEEEPGADELAEWLHDVAAADADLEDVLATLIHRDCSLETLAAADAYCARADDGDNAWARARQLVSAAVQTGLFT
jgi:hypothetical protein